MATNYRLGVLGFLVHNGARGNQAIQDQRAAMRWAIANIRNFGGNPSQLTVWGESAGAMSVAVHLVSPASRGLFQRAILESNVAAFRYQKAIDQVRMTATPPFALGSITPWTHTHSLAHSAQPHNHPSPWTHTHSLPAPLMALLPPPSIASACTHT